MCLWSKLSLDCGKRKRNTITRSNYKTFKSFKDVFWKTTRWKHTSKTTDHLKYPFSPSLLLLAFPTWRASAIKVFHAMISTVNYALHLVQASCTGFCLYLTFLNALSLFTLLVFRLKKNHVCICVHVGIWTCVCALLCCWMWKPERKAGIFLYLFLPFSDFGACHFG